MKACSIAFIAVLCLVASDDLGAQVCQGCTCSGSKEMHSATSLRDCVEGCSTIELVCNGRDIVPTTTVIGLGFGGKPQNVPKDCTVRTVPNGGMLTGKPASGCSGARRTK
jgi:hypothetical protein